MTDTFFLSPLFYDSCSVFLLKRVIGICVLSKVGIDQRCESDANLINIVVACLSDLDKKLAISNLGYLERNLGFAVGYIGKE